MPIDSTATKSRILEAAFREFATYGLAGARVDRIAAAAQANKRAIYEYFGNKETLFDLTLVDAVGRGTEEVPQRWDDLPAYAGLIYDYFLADPDRMRIHLWRHLERPQPLDGETEAYAQMIKGMTAARPEDSLFAPADLFALVWALHFTWFLAFPTVTPASDAAAGPSASRTADYGKASTTHETDNGGGEPSGSVDGVEASRRAVIVEAVRQLVANHG